MVTEQKLIFSGTRWQAAQVTGSEPVRFRAFPRGSGPAPPSRTIFTLTASGHGRGWSTDQPLAFWRDFAKIDLNSANAVLDFVRRRGDPFGFLDAGEETHTGHWANLKALLQVAAQAWEPPGARCVSRITADAKRVKLAEHFLESDPKPFLADVKPVLDPAGGARIVLHVETLAAFMVLSAASAIERRVPMRRCDHCGSWLEFTRRDTRFCSASCRSLHSQQRKEA
jgi:hypothetical protein